MSHIARPLLRLVVGPAVVATFAGFELRYAGAVAAVSGAWLVFAICVLGIGAWGKVQLERSQRRLRSRRNRRSSRTQ